MSHIIDISDDSFEQDVLKSETPVLVDYWAEWCGPCKALTPILEETANDYTGRLTIAKLNIDKNQNTPAKYGVRGIPNLILFKQGEVADSHVGMVSRSQLDAFLKDHL